MHYIYIYIYNAFFEKIIQKKSFISVFFEKNHSFISVFFEKNHAFCPEFHNAFCQKKKIKWVICSWIIEFTRVWIIIKWDSFKQNVNKGKS